MGTVSYTMETLPHVDKEDLEKVASLKDEEIDCSDIPEIKDLSGLRPRQVSFTCNLDADIVEWLKQSGKDNQSYLNSILRQVMVHTQ